ncbi:MAG: phenylalanine--tRNA ligase subunit beta [Candidatus Saccharibacteria bacterium]|nr:phenylalanine--tRNA ligase subunit beta [Candidatus Saccharibacteria bacterium]
MKMSLNWVKKFTDVHLPVNELIEKIGAQLGAVDEVIDIGKKYEGIVAAKVVECVKHPNADKLSICLIDDGGVVKDVKRNEKGLVEVVCGAPNVKAGQMVAWLPPGVTVPSTFDKDPFVLEARELRGVVSNGMIASARELALGDDHEGILVLGDNLKPGESFTKAYELDDVAIDIENKMFTHRPDLFGMLGIAREIAGIQHKLFKSPDWYREDADLNNDGRKNVLKLSVSNEVPGLVPRFCAIAIKDVKIEDSPVWLRTYLARIGVRPINNIVDLTNYFMLETAQPLHAYDYDKIKTGVLGVREAREGEQVTVIGGKTIKLKKGTIVITDGQKPIGLGGVMGGADTEVDKQTKNIVLEVATFDMNTTRRTAMEHGLFTDAATRFTKNQSPRQNRAVLVKAVAATKKIAGGRVASEIVDDKHFKTTPVTVKTTAEFINARLGLDLPAREMKQLLENVEFKVELDRDTLRVTVPFWRMDIEIAEDIVEEIGRLYGYDHLPPALPQRSIAPAEVNEELAFKARVRAELSAAGANEVLTYSFVHESLLSKTGQDIKNAYHIRNALSPDLQYYRVSLTPSLLDKVHPNIKNGFDSFGVYEMNKAHIKGILDDEKLPKEFNRLSLVLARKKPAPGAPFYRAKRYIEYLLSHNLGIAHSYIPVDESDGLPKEWQIAAAAYEPKRTAVIVASDKTILGIVGEPTPSAKNNLKLPAYTSQFELDMDAMKLKARPHPMYLPLNKYPETTQDICLRFPADISYAQAESFLFKALENASKPHGYQYWLKPIDIFQKPEDKAHKQITWHIILTHPERTLTTEEVNKLFDIIASDAKKELKAERI